MFEETSLDNRLHIYIGIIIPLVTFILSRIIQSRGLWLQIRIRNKIIRTGVYNKKLLNSYFLRIIYLSFKMIWFTFILLCFYYSIVYIRGHLYFKDASSTLDKLIFNKHFEIVLQAFKSAFWHCGILAGLLIIDFIFALIIKNSSIYLEEKDVPKHTNTHLIPKGWRYMPKDMWYARVKNHLSKEVDDTRVNPVKETGLDNWKEWAKIVVYFGNSINWKKDTSVS